MHILITLIYNKSILYIIIRYLNFYKNCVKRFSDEIIRASLQRSILGSRKWLPKRFNPRAQDLIIAIVDNLHSRIIRFEVSHYQKARGLAWSLVKAFKRTGWWKTSKISSGGRGGGWVRCLPPTGRSSRATSLWYYEENAAEHEAGDEEKRNGEKKRSGRGEKPLTGASCDLSAAAVQNARNKDFYRARLRRRRTLKRICNFREIPLMRLRCSRLFVRSLLILSFRHWNIH